jgi:hypothetical protein
MVSFYVVDRFDAPDRIVLEDDEARTFTVPRPWLPANTREGDVISVHVDAATTAAASELRLTVDADETARRLREAGKLRQQLPRGPKGDVSL